VGFNVNVAGGEVTTSVTLITAVIAPTVTVMVAGYEETGRVYGFTRTVKLAGNVPTSGLTVSHVAVTGAMEVV
jgi:hypothetical protein